jgi:hypothetical protein
MLTWCAYSKTCQEPAAAEAVGGYGEVEAWYKQHERERGVRGERERGRERRERRERERQRERKRERLSPQRAAPTPEGEDASPTTPPPTDNEN